MSSVCLPCAGIFGDTSKDGIGIWRGTCSICGREYINCGESSYDFGIAEEDVILLNKIVPEVRKRSLKRGWMML
jgi:hypothetical protein